MMKNETDHIEAIARAMWEKLDPKGLACGAFPWADLSPDGKHQWRLMAQAAIEEEAKWKLGKC